MADAQENVRAVRGEILHPFRAEEHAYLAAASDGLQVIDVSDPTTPTVAGSWVTPYQAWGVAVAGSYAYVADGDAEPGACVAAIAATMGFELGATSTRKPTL